MKTILFFILALVFSSNIHAQTTAIPDTAFEQKLITLGIDSDGLVNGQILNSDAAGVTMMNIGASNISSLVGIEAFVNLEILYCTSNNMTSLDLINNIALKEVHCGHNNLTSLNLINNTALTILSCTSNNLTSLDLTNNAALLEVYCVDNQLISLNIGSAALTRLDCYDNNLTSLDLTNNINLNSLRCSHNSLTSLDLTSNLALEMVQCSYNSLASLDLGNNTTLLDLNCSYNNLTSLDMSNNTGLFMLDCGYNNLTSLDMSNNTALTSLYCEYNNLINLDVSNNTALASLYCYNNSLTNLDVSFNTLLQYLFCQNNSLRELDVTANPGLNYLFCRNNWLYLKICVPNLQVAITNGTWQKDITATYLEDCLPLAIIGQVVIDANSNCLVDSLEQGLLGQLVQFVRLGDTSTSYFTTYDSLGNYRAYIDTGVYSVTVIPSSTYWQACPNTQQVTIDTSYTIQTIDWTLQPLVLCPFLEVDISAPFLRMTGGGSNYTVSYCNNGTAVASNAYVEVDLDSDLNFINSTIPVTSQIGTIYTFNIGTVGVGDCGSFDIQVLVDTSAQFQQTHCTEVHIYPDSICVPIWSSAIVNGGATCQNDSVFFYIENTGAAMLQPQPYSIIEDNIAMRTGTVQLGAVQSTTIAQAAAAGKTYRIEIQQLPGFPALLGDSVFSAVIEGCNPHPNGSFNTGFVTQFSNGYSSPFMAIDCQQNVASFDPNDKSAQPEGYGVDHYIYNSTAIDYKIRFQNTGTDTAFNIVIVDTLSLYVDIASLQMGASSHPYEWQIEDGHVLKVSFLNIMLVDSNANEPLSHGFFRYRIEQKQNNPIGTVINNQAAIYFDYNAAIMTNTTFHTIGENFVATTVSIGEIYEEQISVTAFPNPFTNATTIKVEGKEYLELQLSVFDITGRQVAQKQTSSTNQLELSRGNLQPGVYIYQLIGDGNLINTGKIVVN